MLSSSEMEHRRVEQHFGNSEATNGGFSFQGILNGDLYLPAGAIALSVAPQKVLEWVSPLNFHATQADRFGRRQEGTGTWIMKTPEFNVWIRNSGQVLWCPGLPGAGKTILASILINYLETSINSDCALLYIYCMYKEQGAQTDSNLVSSLFQQLLQQRDDIPDQILALYRKHLKRRTRPSLDEWTDILETEIRTNWQQVYVVIDALDECTEEVRTTLLERVRGLPHINLLATSRPNHAIRNEFVGCPSIEIRAIEDDLIRYIKGRIPKHRRLKFHITSDPTLMDEIEQRVVAEAQGMFLLAQLHMDALSKKHTRREVRQALRSLPRSLDTIYDEAMDRIEAQGDYDAELAKKILYWASYSLRPLTIVEMQHALGIQLEDNELDNDGLPPEEILTSICSGLITIDEQSSVVRLVHYTTQEYLERVRDSRFPGAQGDMASICLTYLSFNIFGNGPCQSDSEMDARMHKYPLMEYAAVNWGHHARGDGEQVVKNICLKLLEDPMKLLSACQSMHLPAFHHSNFSQLFPRSVNGIHFAAGFGLSDLLAFLLGTGRIDADLKDSNQRGPLSWAAQNGHLKTTQILLGCYNMDINWQDKDRRTPLILAVANGHMPVAKHLLAKGALPGMSDGEDRTALTWASINGHEGLVRLLLSLNVEVGLNATDKTCGRTPLLWAAYKGHSEIVRLLLGTKHVDVNTSDTAYGQTPLMLASQLGYLDIVRQLLEIPGQDIDRPDDTGESSLIAATRGGHDEIVELLLRYKGVNLEESQATVSLLSWANCVGPSEVEDALLQILPTDHEPADEAAECASLFSGTTLVDPPTAPENPLRDSLENRARDMSAIEDLAIWATKAGSKSIVALLHKIFRVSFRQKDKLFGRTALAWASHTGQVDIMEVILSSGYADVNDKDNCGQSPLSLAAQAGRDQAAARLLRENSIEPDSQDMLGRQPLSFASGNGKHGIVQMLMARHDVNVDLRDNYQETALSWGAERGWTAAVRLLMDDSRVKLDSRNIYGRSPFSLAVGNGFEDIVRMFLDSNRIDVTSRDNFGRMPLAWAVANKQDATAQMLREYLAKNGIVEI